MRVKIINRGRGPEIEGTRISVYDVLDQTRHGWHRDRLAALFRLSSRDIQAALEYIDQQHEAVMASYPRLGARQQEYPQTPEVAATIAASRQRAHTRCAVIPSSRLGEPEEQPHGRHHGGPQR